MPHSRERDIVQSFIGFADSLVEDYDLLDLVTQLTEGCARLLDITAAGCCSPMPAATQQPPDRYGHGHPDVAPRHWTAGRLRDVARVVPAHQHQAARYRKPVHRHGARVPQRSGLGSDGRANPERSELAPLLKAPDSTEATPCPETWCRIDTWGGPPLLTQVGR